MGPWNIEPLQAKHERGEFTCGKSPLDTFLRKLASQYEKRRLGRTYVATEAGEARVAGYYTIAAGSFDVSALAESERTKLPKHRVPTIHLGRLAVDLTSRGQGLGEILLLHALRSALELSQKVGAFAVEVLAVDDESRAFYLKYGFMLLEDGPRHLYIPMKTVAALFDGDRPA